MSNNVIVPGFDKISMKEQASWLHPYNVNIVWQPISVELHKSQVLSHCLEIRLSGELDFFAAAHLAGQLHKAIEAGFKYLIIGNHSAIRLQNIQLSIR